jgi:hypothetical protein
LLLHIKAALFKPLIEHYKRTGSEGLYTISIPGHAVTTQAKSAGLMLLNVLQSQRRFASDLKFML